MARPVYRRSRHIGDGIQAIAKVTIKIRIVY